MRGYSILSFRIISEAKLAFLKIFREPISVEHICEVSVNLSKSGCRAGLESFTFFGIQKEFVPEDPKLQKKGDSAMYTAQIRPRVLPRTLPVTGRILKPLASVAVGFALIITFMFTCLVIPILIETEQWIALVILYPLAVVGIYQGDKLVSTLSCRNQTRP